MKQVAWKDLRCCPFCANPNVQMVLYPADGERRFTNRYAVLCNYDLDGCGAESGHYHSPEEAAEHWNTRKRKWEYA